MHQALTRVLPLAAAVAVHLPAQQFQFSPYTVRPAASFVPVQGPVRGGFTIGDLDSDGRNDVVVCETTTGRANLGAGVRLQLPNTLHSQRPQLRDLDGDGDLDVVLLTSSQPLQILRNDRNGFIEIQLPAPIAGAALAGAAIGDLDGDGDDDIVVCCSGQQLVLLRNDGAMQFTVDATLLPPLGVPLPQLPALIDFDGDGDLDVLAPTVLSVGNRLLRNMGSTFVDASSLLPPIPGGVRDLSVADFDGDGHVDVAMLVNDNLDVLWGTGGGLTLQQVLASTGASTIDLVDFDGDGDPDLVSGRNSVQLLQNLGGRQFARSTIVNEAVSAVGEGDVDGDGRPDILFATTVSPDWVRCWRGGAGEVLDAPFHLGPRSPFANLSSTPFAGDVDGDGRTDLLIPTLSGLVVDHAIGDGSFAVTVSTAPVASGGPELPHLADLDLDGDLDLVIAEPTALRAYRNDGSGNFTRVLDVPTAYPATPGYDDTRLGDVDGDGDLDLVRINSNYMVLVRNLGACTFAGPQIITSGSVSSPGIGIAAIDLLDLDGDGDLDVVCNFTQAGGGHQILTNNGSGVFTPVSSFAIDLGLEPWSLTHLDIDGDGDQDLFVGSPISPRLLRNDGAGVFTVLSATYLPPASTLTSIIANVLCADFDGDGDVDVFGIANPSGGVYRAVLLINDGTGHFADGSVARIGPFRPANNGSPRLVAADLDDDGDLDIITGGDRYAPGSQVILENSLRHLRTATVARIGDSAEFTIHSGPGFGPTGIALLGVSFARANAPLTLPGFVGRLQLEPALLQIAAAVPISTVGVSSVFVPVPGSPPLVGLEVLLQAAIVPTTGAPGLTNALYEVVLR